MDYLVVDFEFTFYKKPIGRPRTFFSEIIEIGAVKFIGDSLKQKCRLQNLNSSLVKQWTQWNFA